MPLSLTECWKQVFSRLSETKRLLLGNPDIEVQGDCITITFRDAFTQKLFAENHLSQMEVEISKLSERPIRVIARSLDNVTQKPIVADGKSGMKRPALEKTPPNVEPIYRSRPRLNFNFDGFVVGVSNREAFEAAQAVARWEAGFDTLFLTGPIGCGKTHLLWSAWRRVMETREKVKTCYVLASDFVGHFIRISGKEATRPEKLAFDNLYSAADLFLMDDIHDLVGRTGSQRQLRICIEKLSDRGAYVMFSSKCSLAGLRPDPKDEKLGLVDELYSRLQGFLSAQIRPPDFNLRVAILLSKAREKPVPFELNIGLAQEIARRSNAPDVRPLEGIIKALKVKVNCGAQVDLTLINELIEDVPKKKLDRETIIKAVAEHFGIPIPEILSKSRFKPMVRARHVAFFLCRKLLPEISTTTLGTYFGRDHSSILHGVEQIRDGLKIDLPLQEELKIIESKILS